MKTEYMFYFIMGYSGVVKELIVVGNSLAPFHLDTSPLRKRKGSSVCC